MEIQNPVSHYDQKTQADSQGRFALNNVPFNNYHLSAVASGFQNSAQDVDVRSSIPVEISVSLTIGTSTTAVTVEAAADLVENDPTTHTDIDRGLFDKLPPKANRRR